MLAIYVSASLTGAGFGCDQRRDLGGHGLGLRYALGFELGGGVGAQALVELGAGQLRDKRLPYPRRGRKVALIDKAGRIKPCGGAIPPRLIRDCARRRT